MQAHTRIKLCGMTGREDVQQAVALGVDYIGLIFAAHSPRKLSLEQALVLRAEVPATTQVVALLMGNPRADIAAIIATLRPDILQFHGDEDPAFCAAFGLPFFKAIAMGDGADPRPAMARFAAAAGLVLDGHGAGEQGGSGQRFDWSRLPRQHATPVLLAGGLNADNVAQALAIAQPWGVDVASGIEASPGVKDAAAMQHFVAAVRASDAARAAIG